MSPLTQAEEIPDTSFIGVSDNLVSLTAEGTLDAVRRRMQTLPNQELALGVLPRRYL